MTFHLHFIKLSRKVHVVHSFFIVGAIGQQREVITVYSYQGSFETSKLVILLKI